jgi:hypothetical protein
MGVSLQAAKARMIGNALMIPITGITSKPGPWSSAARMRFGRTAIASHFEDIQYFGKVEADIY